VNQLVIGNDLSKRIGRFNIAERRRGSLPGVPYRSYALTQTVSPEILLERYVTGHQQSNFRQTDDGISLSIEYPGIRQEQLDVSLNPADRRLEITVMDVEQPTVRLSRRIEYVPENVDTSKDPKAVLDLGILTIVFQEDEQEKPRSIEVGVEDK
jgi:HSP20 family molecular chaperone IbpA